jgi:hypothetical protein
MDNVDLCTTWHKKKWHGLLWWWLEVLHFLLKLLWKVSEKTELNEVAIIRTKKR